MNVKISKDARFVKPFIVRYGGRQFSDNLASRGDYEQDVSTKDETV